MIEIRCDENWDELIDLPKIRNILIIFLKHLFSGEHGISLYLTDDAEIQKLNKEFRDKDGPTDILSWTYAEDDPALQDAEIINSEEENFAGELVVSVERVRQQSVENGWNFETELIRLLAHGCAHLADLDHE